VVFPESSYFKAGNKEEGLDQSTKRRNEHMNSTNPTKSSSVAKKAAVFVLSALMLLMSFGAPAFAALQSVGPVDTNNGFPVSYTDANGLTLKQCLDLFNCTLLVADIPSPGSPLSFPANWPEEIFYWTGDAFIQTAGPVPGVALDASLIMAIEGAFFNGPVLPGDQVTFSRIRLKINGLLPNSAYTITHPYGVLNLNSDANGTILFVNDCGMGLGGDPAGFSFLLDCPIGPFLTWDTTQSTINPDTGLPMFDPPAGFIGDANFDHQVTGSPFNTNFFKIEGPGFPLAGVSTDLFVVTGQISNVPPAGTTILGRATYSRPSVGVPQAHIFASAKTTSQLVVSSVGGDASPLAGPIFMQQIMDPGVPPAAATPTNEFFVNVDLSANLAGALPRNIIITDLTLNPPETALSVTLTDRVDITSATYNQATSTLTVTAASSDEVSNPTLTVLGNANGVMVGGSFSAVLPGPPGTVTVQSSLGGVSTADVVLAGPGSTATAPVFAAPVANAGIDQTVFFNTRVDVSAAASTGVIAEYAWAQIAGPAVSLSNPFTSDVNFNFPAPVAPATTVPPITLQVTVTGPGGVSVDTVVIDSIAIPPVVPTIDRADAKLQKDEWKVVGHVNPTNVAGTTITSIIVTDAFGATADLIAGAGGVPVDIDAAGLWAFQSKQVPLTGNLGAGPWTLHAVSSTGTPGPEFNTPNIQ